MIFWSLYIPIASLVIILYFNFLDVIFAGRKKAFLIDEEKVSKPSIPEIRNTIINLLIFAIVGLILGYFKEKGVTQVYDGTPTHFLGWIYMVISFFIALLLHDIYFYWSHRLLHTTFFFRYIHVHHHQSHHPNAWSAFSFHPAEGIIQIGIVLIVALITPVHEWILISFTTFLLFISVYGHCGYELRPNKLKVFNVFNTSLHHYQHHTKIHYNFGIYLNFWDKIFKTDYPEYDKTFKDLSKSINLKAKIISSSRAE